MATDRRKFLRAAGAATVLAAAAAPLRADAASQLDPGETLLWFFKRLDALNRARAFNRPATEHPWILMASDGIWVRDGHATSDRIAFDVAIAKLPHGLVTSHVVGNLTLDRQLADQASADFSLSISSGQAHGPQEHVAFDLPGAILKCAASLLRGPSGWRISRMESETIFRGRAAAADIDRRDA
jgi:hypothetical protein